MRSHEPAFRTRMCETISTKERMYACVSFHDHEAHLLHGHAWFSAASKQSGGNAAHVWVHLSGTCCCV